MTDYNFSPSDYARVAADYAWFAENMARDAAEIAASTVRLIPGCVQVSREARTEAVRARRYATVASAYARAVRRGQ